MRDLSIIIPAYNEASSIGKRLFSIANFLEERDRDDEVIVVNDGSIDNTATVAQGYAHLFKHFQVIDSDRNIGRGHAVRKGLLTATGTHRLVVDTDTPVDINEFDTMISAAEAEPVAPAIIDGTFADTALSGRSTTGRQGLGRLATRLVQATVPVSELGFRIYAGDAIDAILTRCQSNGWAFDVEALSYARGLGYHVLEVPVSSERREDSTVRYLAAGFEVARFKLRNELGLRDLERV